jgi:hypothetical protein
MTGALAVLCVAAPASAQQGLIDLVPRQEFTDANGVDLAGATYRHHEALLRIGGGAHPLALNLHITSPGLVQTAQCPTIGMGDIGNDTYLALDSHAYLGNTAATALYTAVLPHQSAKFGIYTSSGGQLPWIVVPSDAVYVTGSFDSPHTQFSYIGGDGTEATFSSLHTAPPAGLSVQLWGNVEQVRYPDGETWTYRYNDVQYSVTGCAMKVSRVRSIVSSRGYAIQFDYAADATGTVTSQSVIQNFVSPVRATAYNKASLYCDEAVLQSCASVTALSSAVTFAYDRANQKVTITKPNGEQVALTFGWLMDTRVLTSVARPAGATRTMTYDGWAEQEGPTYRYVTSLTEAGRIWGYGFAPSSGGNTTSVNEPGGPATVYYFTNGIPYMVLDPLLRQTWVDYDGYMRFLRRRYPEGNEVTAAYDGRGNLNLVRQIPKAGSDLPALQASAVYPASCTSADRRSCNRPTSTTDRNGNTTDYTYDPAHGGVLTETGPWVPTRQNDGSIASVRPQKRYEYAQRTAWISNGAGGYVQAATPVWLPVRERSCRTTAASGSGCAGGAADEIVTDYDYGPNSGPNNLLLRGTAVTADGGPGLGLVTRRTCYSYDANGNRISETQPNANLASCP